MVRYNFRWLSVIGIRGRFGTWTAWNANHSNLKDSSERSERGGKFFSGFRATYVALSMFLDQPRLDHLLWLSQDKILRIVVNRNGGPPTVASDHLSLSHVPSRLRSYIDRSTIVNAIRDTWKPWNTATVYSCALRDRSKRSPWVAVQPRTRC